MFRICTDGACLGNPGPGGWASIIINDEGRQEFTGNEHNTTSNRMEIKAVIEGLKRTPRGSEVTVESDSQYVINTMTRNWKRKANLDLWKLLDDEVDGRLVSWVWVRGHVGHPENERANRLANDAARTLINHAEPTHFDNTGTITMVDITEKAVTERVAIAGGTVHMNSETIELIKNNGIAKGNVFAVAYIAGTMAAKQTSQLIPLCHPLAISSVDLHLQLCEDISAIKITATVKTVAQTGVEMEALTAVSVAALTIYDMCKAVDRGIRINEIRLIRKSGGRSGEIILEGK